MKGLLCVCVCILPTAVCGQVEIGKPWTLALGTSSGAFVASPSLNLRYLSPRFRWKEEWTVEEEKNPALYKNSRLRAELIYAPPLKTLCAGFNMQFRLFKTKRSSFEIYGGMKFVLANGREPLSAAYGPAQGTQVWYMNMGILWQYEMGPLAPFADLGGDGVITLGTEFRLKPIYRQPKRRYDLKKPRGARTTH